MFKPSRRRLAVTVAAAGAAIVLFPAAALADNPPPAQVLSNYENSTGNDLVRDCGFSQPLPADPAESLWLFCDTATYGFSSSGQWGLTGFISGSTAAEGPYTAGEVPSDLSEVPTPGTGTAVLPNDNGPSQFLPVPSGLVTGSSGASCDSADGAYAASWITGVTQDPYDSSDVLISFNNYCVLGNLDYLAEGFGLAEYDPATNTLDSQVTVEESLTGSALPAPDLLGSPVVSGGYVYFFGSYCAEIYDVTCISETGDAVYLARVRADPWAWSDASDYQWYAGPSSWTSSSGSAVSLISGATPLAVSVGSFPALGEGLVMVEQTNDVGGFTVYQASSPAGAWTQLTSGTLPCAAVGSDLCHAYVPHPELSTSSDLMISFFNPAATPYYQPGEPAEGHLEVAAVPW
jgi:hypothetical protein